MARAGHACSHCQRLFRTAYNLEQHQASFRCLGNASARSGAYQCQECKQVFSRKDSLTRHVGRFHPPGHELLRFACGICSTYFPSAAAVKEHRRQEHALRHHSFQVVRTAHRKTCQQLRLFFPRRVESLDAALFFAYDKLRVLIEALSAETPYFKLDFFVHLEMVKFGEDGEVVRTETFPFRGKQVSVSRERECTQALQMSLGDVERNVEQFLFQGSGWCLDRPVFLDAEVAQCNALSGTAGCGLHIAARVRGKQGLDFSNLAPDGSGMCFFFAVARGVLGASATAGEMREFVAGLSIPVSWRLDEVLAAGLTVEHIAQVESLNWQTLKARFNVAYMDEDGNILPYRASPYIDEYEHEVNMLLFHAETGNGGVVGHYSYITDPDLLFASRQRRQGSVCRTQRQYICWNCFNRQASARAHANHLQFCLRNSPQQVQMPLRGDRLSFKPERAGGDARTFRSAYTLYYDFEALSVEPDSACSCSEGKLNNTKALKEEMRKFLRHMSPEEQCEHLIERRMLAAEAHDEWVLRARAYEQGLLASPPPAAGPSRIPPTALEVARRRAICTHKTFRLREQPPFAYSLVLIDRNGKVLEKKSYMNADAADNFVETVLDLSDKYLPGLSPGEPMLPLTEAEQKDFETAQECYLCEQPFESHCQPKWAAVRDHDHLDGRYLGAAHSVCNLRRRERITLTCFCHNFSSYDSHFLVGPLNRQGERVFELGAIPSNTQKFKVLIANRRIRFLDSCAFLEGSLAQLATVLKKSGSTYPISTECLGPTVTEEDRELLHHKLKYPYTFATSIGALKRAKSLPPIDAFHNDLSGEPCSAEDYATAQRVWDKFGCRSMADYTALYMASDTFLLADVMTNFRDLIWEKFNLDLCAYFSLPHLSLDAMLYLTGAEVELIHDQEMAEMFKNNIRGGHSYVNLRYAHVADFSPPTDDDRRRQDEGSASETENEDGEKAASRRFLRRPSHLLHSASLASVGCGKSSIAYLDANNLYGCAMKEPMPISGFRWLSDGEIEAFDVERDVTDEDGGTGYVLEVDLDYPEGLHAAHNDFPLAPETMDVCWEDLSPYSRECCTEIHDKRRHAAKKLTSTFRPRKRYVVHGRNLKYYLSKGLKLVKIHRAVAFVQRAFIRPFIELCTQMRREAKTETERQMWKLVANSTFGKFIENPDRRLDIRFSRNEDRARRNASSPLYQGCVVVDNDLSLMFHRKKTRHMKSCYPVGFTILELSKLVMQRLFYEHVQPKLGGPENVSVMLSDTDSFLLHVRHHSDDDVLRKLAHVMDLSNLPPEHPLFDDSRAKEPGLLKNEVPNSRIVRACCVRCKSYVFETEAGLVKASAKGVKKAAQRHLNFDKYAGCVAEKRDVRVNQKVLQSRNHRNYLLSVTKAAFSSLDDKRFQLCPVHSTPYGSSLASRPTCWGCARDRRRQTLGPIRRAQRRFRRRRRLRPYASPSDLLRRELATSGSDSETAE